MGEYFLLGVAFNLIMLFVIAICYDTKILIGMLSAVLWFVATILIGYLLKRVLDYFLKNR